MIKVLIVDDEQFVRVSLRTLYDWEKNGFSIVATADDGFDALKKIEEHSPDIVITDIAMPGMDGLALLQEIKERGIDCVTMVISNLGDVHNIKAAMKIGAEDYCLKVDFEQEEFNKAMLKLKALVMDRKKAQMPPVRAQSGPNCAERLASALKDGDIALFEFPESLHVFCIHIREYLSETLNTFGGVYRPLGNIVTETFGSFSSISYARAPWPNSMLVTAEDDPLPCSASYIMKRLDGQIRVYLQVNADISHYSNTTSHGDKTLFDKLDALSREILHDKSPRHIYDDDGQSAETDSIDRVVRYIDENIGKNVSLTEIAEHVALNASYLSRMFKLKMGVPLVQYMTEQKMKRAALLLSSGNYRVKEAAALLGFEDQYYFTKLFYKIHHVSPTEYMSGDRRSSEK